MVCIDKLWKEIDLFSIHQLYIVFLLFSVLLFYSLIKIIKFSLLLCQQNEWANL